MTDTLLAFGVPAALNVILKRCRSDHTTTPTFPQQPDNPTTAQRLSQAMDVCIDDAFGRGGPSRTQKVKKSFLGAPVKLTLEPGAGGGRGWSGLTSGWRRRRVAKLVDPKVVADYISEPRLLSAVGGRAQSLSAPPKSPPP